ncbi:MAG: transposase, partial [Pseudomonadota bacterium]|nr:transposase [Pseudomonadota bacterium]
LEDGTPAHSFRTLMDELGTVVRNTCRTRGSGNDAPSFEIVTTPNPKQAHAIKLLQTITL